MTLPNLRQNSMTFPEIPEKFKISEIPWLLHDRGNPGSVFLFLFFFLPTHHSDLQVVAIYVTCILTNKVFDLICKNSFLLENEKLISGPIG